MCLKCKLVMVVVSTSSAVWSQVRRFFILEYFCTINHDEIRESLWLSLMFYSMCVQYASELHNSSMFTIAHCLLEFQVVQ